MTAARDQRPEVAHAHLHDAVVLGDRAQSVVVEPDARHASDDGDRRRDGTAGAGWTGSVPVVTGPP